VALRDLLYRCPQCGLDPLPGLGDVADCPQCGARFERGSSQTRVRVTLPGQDPFEVEARHLTAEIDRHGGPLPAGDDPRGEPIIRRARVHLQEAGPERPVRWGGRLLGFVERFGDPRDGVLSVTAETLSFADTGGRREEWDLEDLTALQASSSKVQVRTSGGRLLQFRFLEESPRRWESLLRHLVAVAWRRSGRGEVVEFQPRITTR
jgi:hypothetical protein